MRICREVGFYELKEQSWSGAIDTLNRIEDEGMEEELMDFLEECFTETPTDTEVNDFLWFEDEYIFEVLGIKDEDEDEEDEDEEEESDEE